jgi:hypothetical protein
MGLPDQWLKAVLKDETPTVTGNAATFDVAPEIGTTDLRPDGIVRTVDAARLQHLAAPWSLLRHEAVFDGKMPGDHLGPAALQRHMFRREARQAQRFAEDPEMDPDPWLCMAWMHAPYVPRWMHDRVKAKHLRLRAVAQGCWSVTPSMYPVIWIAANELPLREELIPFLIARTGDALKEFTAWVVERRTPAWLGELMYARPEVGTMIESLIGTGSPEHEERVRTEFSKLSVVKKLVAEERAAERVAALAPLVHQFSRRLGRPITDAERAELLRRLDTLGADRIGDVVLDLAPNALAAWLADPAAT